MNRWLLLAVLWFAAGVYGLIFRETGGSAPPVPHFDKLAHFGLFFGQFWLLAKIFMQKRRAIPFAALLLMAAVLAAGSEWAQGAFTLARAADWRDALADMLGASAALWLAARVAAAKYGGGKRSA